MSQPSGKPIYIPPYCGVRLYECRDRITLALVPSFREFFALGKIKARDAVLEIEEGDGFKPWPNAPATEEIWTIVQWVRFEDGREEKGAMRYLRNVTKEEALAALKEMEVFYATSKKDLKALAQCVNHDEDQRIDTENYIEIRHPNYQLPPADPKALDEHDLYQARLKVLAGLTPKTVELIKKANGAADLVERRKIEREAVQAYFAELAQDWTEDEVLIWQRSNPVGTEWLLEFARVMQEPQREIDPINHELALNWLRRKYNLLTEAELSDSILMATLQRLTPGALKKRRERLELATKRSPGPRPNSERQ